MKILHVITGLSTGGAEKSLYNILSGGLARRFDTSVLSLGNCGTVGGAVAELDVPIHTLDMQNSFPTPKILGRLQRIVRGSAPDIIQGWMYHGNLAASLGAGFSRSRCVVMWNVRQSLYNLKAEKPLTRQVIRANRFCSRKVGGIIYNSHLSQIQHAEFGFDDRRARVIPNGFDLDGLRHDRETRQRVRAELGVSKDTLLIGHVARFHPMKDHVGFLRAAVRVARLMPHTRFLLIGRDVSPENPAISGIVPTALSGRFLFTGERPDVEQLMQAMDLLCSSSWSEAFPNVLGEAMAFGVPCVATDVGDNADILGNAGIIIPPSDSNALAEGLLAMLDKDAADRERLGQNARKRIAQHYSLQRIVKRYAELYEELYDE